MLNHIDKGERKNPAVLFLHGFMGCASDWNPVMDQLSAQYYCLAVDLPGHGRSVLPAIPENQIITYLTNSIEDFLIDHEIPEAVLAGYSMGGRLAIEMLRQKPERINALILESASPGITDINERSARLKADITLADRLEMEDFKQFLNEWYKQPVFASLQNHADLNQLIDKRAENDPVQLAKILRGFSVARQESSWPQMVDPAFPCLYMAGERDKKYTDLARKLATASAKLKVAIIPDAGHNIHFEQPDKYLSTVRSFLETEV